MKVTSIIICLALLFVANVVATTLAKGDILCSIVSKDGPVSCRMCPSIECDVIKTLDDGTEDSYYCYSNGYCIEDSNWCVRAKSLSIKCLILVY
jgi:hypothetical protein